MQRYNVSIISLKDWCQIYLQRYPPEIMSSLDVFRINKILKDKVFEIKLKRIADIVFSFFL